jgi:hypothetical protein
MHIYSTEMPLLKDRREIQKFHTGIGSSLRLRAHIQRRKAQGALL